MAFSASPLAHTIKALGVPGGATDPINTTGADFLLICLSWYPVSTPTPTVSDSKGNTWNALTPQTTTGGLPEKVRLYWSVPTSVGSGHTFSSGGGDHYPVMTVSAWSGAHQTAPFVEEIGTTSNSTSSLQPGAMTPDVSGCLVICGVATTSTALALSGDGFTESDKAGFASGLAVGGGHGYLVQASAASVNPSWAVNATSEVAVMMAAFQPAAAPAGGGKPMLYYARQRIGAR